MEKDRRLLKICVYVGVTALIFWMIIHYWAAVEQGFLLVVDAGKPLIIGCCVAYAVNVMMTFYESHLPKKIGKLSVKPVILRMCSIILSVLTMVALIVLLAQIVVPELIESIKLMAKELPESIDELMLNLRERSIINEDTVMPEWVDPVLDALKLNSSSMLKLALNYMDQITPAVMTFLTSAVSVIVMLLIMVIFAFYLLGGKDRLIEQTNTLIDVYIPGKRARRLRYVFRTINDCFHKFIVGQCVDALILGALCTVGMLIFRFPYAVMVGTLIGFTALIPIAGAWIGAAAGAFMIFTVDPIKALLFLVYIIVLQQLENNLIYPRVVGTSLQLPGLWVLAAVTIASGIWGVPGLLLGVPITASIYRFIGDDVERRKKLKAQENGAASAEPPKEEPVITEPPKPEKKPMIKLPAKKQKKKK